MFVFILQMRRLRSREVHYRLLLFKMHLFFANQERQCLEEGRRELSKVTFGLSTRNYGAGPVLSASESWDVSSEASSQPLT